MKKYVIFASFAIVLFGVSMANAQSRVLGGYKEIAKSDAAAKKAALFAIDKQAKADDKEIEFISIVKAERQSVSTTNNYRMCVKVSDSGAEGQDAADVYVMIIVNVDAKGNYKLTSYTASDCGEGDEDS